MEVMAFAAVGLASGLPSNGPFPTRERFENESWNVMIFFNCVGLMLTLLDLMLTLDFAQASPPIRYIPGARLDSCGRAPMGHSLNANDFRVLFII